MAVRKSPPYLLSCMVSISFSRATASRPPPRPWKPSSTEVTSQSGAGSKPSSLWRGTDGPGLYKTAGMPFVLEMMVGGGMMPMEAMHAATIRSLEASASGNELHRYS